MPNQWGIINKHIKQYHEQSNLDLKLTLEWLSYVPKRGIRAARTFCNVRYFELNLDLWFQNWRTEPWIFFTERCKNGRNRKHRGFPRARNRCNWFPLAEQTGSQDYAKAEFIERGINSPRNTFPYSQLVVQKQGRKWCR